MITHWETALVLVNDRQRDVRLAADRARQRRQLRPNRRWGRSGTG